MDFTPMCKTCRQPAALAALVETGTGVGPCMDLCHLPAWQQAWNAKPSGPKDARGDRIAFLLSSRPLLIKYAQQKLDAEDFHGLADAAMDLRDLDSELDGLRW